MRNEFRSQLHQLVFEARAVLTDDEILYELIGTMCAHIGTSQLSVKLREEDRLELLVEKIRAALLSSLAFSATMTLLAAHGSLQWEPHDDFDA